MSYASREPRPHTLSKPSVRSTQPGWAIRRRSRRLWDEVTLSHLERLRIGLNHLELTQLRGQDDVSWLSGCLFPRSGVPDMLEGGQEDFLYQASAPYMLAWYVKCLLVDDGLAMNFFKVALERVMRTHDRERNLSDLLDIYDSLTRQGK